MAKIKAAHTQMVPEVEILYKRFKELGYDKISEFIREVHSDITQEAWGSYFYGRKGEYQSPSTAYLLIMMSELSLEPTDMKKILMMRGEHKISVLIEKDNYNSDEKALVAKYRAITDKSKRKLIIDMLDNLGR